MTKDESNFLHAIKQMEDDAINMGLLPLPFKIIRTRVIQIIEERDRLQEQLSELTAQNK